MRRRALEFRSLDEVIVELERLHQEGYVKGGQWGLAEICNHLSVFVRGSMEGFAARAPWYQRLFAPLLLRWMLWARRMPEGVRIPAALQPAAVADEGEEVRTLRELLLRFQRHRGPVCSSPWGDRPTYRQWHDLHLLHCAHHLSFLHPAVSQAAGAQKDSQPCSSPE
ncbi:MAG: DUF1569 domain-containing protein [Gemmataceae bacterium]|nr:DUF1569 domain-containing protein [Gemmataceae bacterium]